MNRHHPPRVPSLRQKYPLPNDSIEATYHTLDADPLNNEAKPILGLINNGAEAVALSALSVRYWTNDGGAQEACRLIAITPALAVTKLCWQQLRDYVEMTFNALAGELAPETTLSDINLRLHHADWSTV